MDLCSKNVSNCKIMNQFMTTVRINEQLLKNWGKQGWKRVSYYVTSTVKNTVDNKIKYEVLYPINKCLNIKK